MGKAPAWQPPDVLVLGVGGILGEAWTTGMLAGIEAAAEVDLRGCEAFVGTSAGSIVAAHLAAGVRPAAGGSPQSTERPEPAATLDDGPLGSLLAAATRWGLAAASPIAPLALAAAAPGGALVRGAVLSRTPRGTRPIPGLGDSIARLGSSFDGRLRVVAVELGSGKRVAFGSPSAPSAGVSQAVEASCSIPTVFRPVEIGGREYVDGGVWSPTNLDLAPVREGSRVLCLVPTAQLGAGRGSPLRPLRAMWRGTVALERAAVERRGAEVEIAGPDAGAAAVMGESLMQPARRQRVLSEGYRQGRRLVADAGARAVA